MEEADVPVGAACEGQGVGADLWKATGQMGREMWRQVCR